MDKGGFRTPLSPFDRPAAGRAHFLIAPMIVPGVVRLPDLTRLTAAASLPSLIRINILPTTPSSKSAAEIPQSSVTKTHR